MLGFYELRIVGWPPQWLIVKFLKKNRHEKAMFRTHPKADHSSFAPVFSLRRPFPVKRNYCGHPSHSWSLFQCECQLV